jgi:Flp pilus assembly protein TadG
MRCLSALGCERGSVTAEFAALVPAVLLVLAFGIGAVEVVVQQARLTDAAADAARSLARGDSRAVADAHVAEAVGATSFSVERGGDYVCVEVGQPARGPAAVTGLSVSGRGCALGDDESIGTGSSDNGAPS